MAFKQRMSEVWESGQFLGYASSVKEADRMKAEYKAYGNDASKVTTGHSVSYLKKVDPDFVVPGTPQKESVQEQVQSQEELYQEFKEEEEKEKKEAGIVTKKEYVKVTDPTGGTVLMEKSAAEYKEQKGSVTIMSPTEAFQKKQTEQLQAAEEAKQRRLEREKEVGYEPTPTPTIPKPETVITIGKPAPILAPAPTPTPIVTEPEKEFWLKTKVKEVYKSTVGSLPIFRLQRGVILDPEEAKQKSLEEVEIIKKKAEPLGTTGKKIAEVSEFALGVEYGIPAGIKKEPAKAAIVAATFVALPFVMKGAGTVLSKLPGATKLSPLVKPTLQYGLPALYGTQVVLETAAQPTLFEKGAKLGETISTEIAPMEFGGTIGTGLLTKYEVKASIEAEIKKLPEAKQKKVKELFELSTKLKEPPIKEVKFTGMERLPKRGHKVTEKFLQEYDVILGGSLAQRTQLYGVSRSYARSDIDIYVKSGITRTEAARTYAKALQKVGIRARVTGTKVYGEEGKIAEFLPYSMLEQNIMSVSGFFEPVGKGVGKTPSGIEVLKVQPQMRRKLVGAYLQQRYSKDMPDFERIVASAIKTTEIQAESSLFKGKAKAEAKEIKTRYSELLGKQKIELKTPTKAKLKSPRPPKTTKAPPVYKSFGIPETKLPAYPKTLPTAKAPTIPSYPKTLQVTKAPAVPVYPKTTPEFKVPKTPTPVAYPKPVTPVKPSMYPEPIKYLKPTPIPSKPKPITYPETKISTPTTKPTPKPTTTKYPEKKPTPSYKKPPTVTKPTLLAYKPPKEAEVYKPTYKTPELTTYQQPATKYPEYKTPAKTTLPEYKLGEPTYPKTTYPQTPSYKPPSYPPKKPVVSIPPYKPVKETSLYPAYKPPTYPKYAPPLKPPAYPPYKPPTKYPLLVPPYRPPVKYPPARPPKYPPTKPPTAPPIPPFFPTPALGGLGGAPGKRPKRPYGYHVDVYSVAFKYTQKKAKKIGLSGFVRPFPAKKKRRSKRKKKRKVTSLW